MSKDRRTDESLSLRAFFDDQLQHLDKLFFSLGHHSPNAVDRQFIESFVDASNTKLRAVHGYSNKLRKPISALYDHVLLIANKIPPPVNLNLGLFETPPLINALFVNNKQVETLFNTDREINLYLCSHSQYQVPVIYSLLTAFKSEKRILGIGMNGDMLLREVPQLAVNFSSHKFHTPCASNSDLDLLLKQYLFGCVVAIIKADLSARLNPQSIKTCSDSYQLRVNSLANPDVYLAALIEHLEIPSKLLSIEKIHFKLSKLGIKLEDNDKQSANEFDLHELTWGNSTKNIALQTAFVR